MHKDSRLLILRLQLETGCGQRNRPAEIPIAMPCVRGQHEQVVWRNRSSNRHCQQ